MEGLFIDFTSFNVYKIVIVRKSSFGGQNQMYSEMGIRNGITKFGRTPHNDITSYPPPSPPPFNQN